MRTCIFACVLAFTLVASGADAEEIVLKTGSVVRGIIESESASEVVLRTRDGRMRIGRSLIREIRRGLGDAAPPAGDGLRAVLQSRVTGVLTGVPPVAAGRTIILPQAAGGVIGFDPGSQKILWEAELGGAVVSGLSADPSGVYLATAEGEVGRLDPRIGSVLWRNWVEGPVASAPLRLRRLLFVFGPDRGLYSLDMATGKIRGLLSLDAAPDTPLATNGRLLLMGTEEGSLLVLGDDGRTLRSAFEAPGRWHGRRLALSLKSVVLGGSGGLTAYDAERGAAGAGVRVPGLSGHPLAAEPSVAYCEIGGVLTAVSVRTGRMNWRAEAAGRVTGIAAGGGSTLVVTTSDGRVCGVAKSNGGLLWSADLGAPGTTPVVVGDRVLVATGAGEAHLFRIEPGEPEAPAGETADRVFRSPAGYRVTVPDGWEIAPQAMRAGVSPGLQPRSGDARFSVPGIGEIDRRRFFLRCRMTVRAVEARDGSAADLGLVYLTEEQLSARRAGQQVGAPAVAEKTYGGRKWTEVRMETTLPAVDGSTEFVKRAAVVRIDEARAVWIELLTPAAHAEVAGRGFEALVASFAPAPVEAANLPPEVVAADRALQALESGDPEQARPWLSEPRRRELDAGLPATSGDRYRLAALSSRARGAFREVLVVVQGEKRHRLARILMGREGDRWAVMDWSELFR